MKSLLKNILKSLGLWNTAVQVLDKKAHGKGLSMLIDQIHNIPEDTKSFLFFPYFHTGGAELVHLQISQCLKDEAVNIFTMPSDNDHFKDAFAEANRTINIERHIRKPEERAKMLHLLANLINSAQPDSVFGCHSDFYYELLPLLDKKIKKVDLIHAFTHPDEPGFEKSTLTVLDQLDERITISEKERENLIELYDHKGINTKEKEKIKIIPNAVRFECEEYPEKPTNTFNVLYVGRNSPEKRIHLIEQIAKQVKENAEIQFHLVGEGLKTTFRDSSPKNVTFYGAVTDNTELAELYSSAHVVIITSSREGMPLSVTEGMVFGCVPICTDVGAIHEHVLNRKNGMLFSNNEEDIVEEFAKQILTLSENPRTFDEMSLSCYEQGRVRYSRKVFCEAYRAALLKHG